MIERFEKCFGSKDEYTHVENHGSFLIERDGHKLSIYFEKSNGKEDWLNNFDFMPESTDGLMRNNPESVKGVLAWVKELIFNMHAPKKAYKDSADGWKCHGGFLKVWKSIEPYINDQINNPMIKEFEVVGYSHGGAIAQLCHEYIRYWRPDAKVTGYGFGAPRIFWGKPSEAVKKRFDGFVIVRHGNDLITHLPPKAFGFTDICRIVEIGDFSYGVIQDHYPDKYWAALYRGEIKRTIHN